jgi:uncharacterized protein (UPF0333 family)
MEEKAQGAFEYVLLLAGILLVAVIAILILRGNIFPSANNTLQNNLKIFTNVSNASQLTS